jgi:glycosyltransferase involved in cell wall biosynthesis
MKSKLLFLSSYSSHFVLADLAILQKHFQVEKLVFSKKSKTIFHKTITFLKIAFAVSRNKLVFCWFADFPAFVAILFAKIFSRKVIVLVGGYETSDIPNYGGLQSRSANLIKFTIKNADKVITVSQFLSQELKTLNLREDATAIHLAINSSSHPVSNKNKIILTCGSVTSDLYKIKGIDVFAKATKNFKAHKKIIVGDFDKKIKNQLLKINPELEFVGRLTHERFLTLLSESEIYCQFSRRESFGMALLEAINANCKVVISRRGALPEVAGEIAITADISKIADCEAALAAAIKAKLVDNSKWVQSGFSGRKREQELLKVISELL